MMAAAKKNAGSKSEQIPETNPQEQSAPTSTPFAEPRAVKSAKKKTAVANSPVKKSVNDDAKAVVEQKSEKQKSTAKQNTKGKSDKKIKKDQKGDDVLVTAQSEKASAKGKKPKHTVRLSVPRGGQLIHYFNLTPAVPTDAGHGDWLFTEVGSKQDIQNVRVEFQRNPSPLERELERAVLVVNMAQDKKAKGKWRFALGGVATDTGDADPNNDVAVEIIDNGFTLVAYVQVLENSRENIPFGFVASFTDEATGVVSIYASKDPGIQPVRPPKP